jgi:hypothetical protein
MDNKTIEFNIVKTTIDVYNEIAKWSNNDFDGDDKKKGDALKIVVQDIVERIVDSVAETMGVKSSVGVFRGDVKINSENKTSKDVESFTKVDEKDIINKLFNK